MSLQLTVRDLVLAEGITPKSVFSTAELMAESEHTSATPDSNGDDTQSSGTGSGSVAAVAATDNRSSGNNIADGSGNTAPVALIVALVADVVSAIVNVDGGFRLFISVSSHDRFVPIAVREEERQRMEVVDFSTVQRSLLIVAAVCKRMGRGRDLISTYGPAAVRIYNWSVLSCVEGFNAREISIQ